MEHNFEFHFSEDPLCESNNFDMMQAQDDFADFDQDLDGPLPDTPGFALSGDVDHFLESHSEQAQDYFAEFDLDLDGWIPETPEFALSGDAEYPKEGHHDSAFEDSESHDMVSFTQDLSHFHDFGLDFTESHSDSPGFELSTVAVSESHRQKDYNTAKRPLTGNGMEDSLHGHFNALARQRNNKTPYYPYDHYSNLAEEPIPGSYARRVDEPTYTPPEHLLSNCHETQGIYSDMKEGLNFDISDESAFDPTSYKDDSWRPDVPDRNALGPRLPNNSLLNGPRQRNRTLISGVFYCSTVVDGEACRGSGRWGHRCPECRFTFRQYQYPSGICQDIYAWNPEVSDNYDDYSTVVMTRNL
jgi:hypothetical protein